MRVLVTGSRDWKAKLFVLGALDDLKRDYGPLTVVHGGCPTGADYYANLWVAKNKDCTREVYPAEWSKYGPSAGPLRNRKMVNTEPDLVLAFIRRASKGASGCLKLAQQKNLDCKIWRMDD